MIITRTPLRVSFFGGGTDIPWYFEEHGPGHVLSMAIDKHVYITGHPMFDTREILLKYSSIERVESADHLVHPIAREVLASHGIQGFDIGVSADVPAGTGLGSSSAFTVGLLNLAGNTRGQKYSKAELAEVACDVEINKLNEPIGKQDQYASAYGGVNLFDFLPDGSVTTHPFNLTPAAKQWLGESLLLVRTGSGTRSASDQLAEQRDAARKDPQLSKKLSLLAQLAKEAFTALEQDITGLGELLKESWALKKESSPSATNKNVDNLVEHGLASGATGAKLLGAGSGGFVLFSYPEGGLEKGAAAFPESSTLRVSVDELGSKVIYRS